jgi:hypothetical protein
MVAPSWNVTGPPDADGLLALERAIETLLRRDAERNGLSALAAGVQP